jgi:D-glycero-D-manno-heptose 1,7-bisphosphate phosphatase
VLPGALEAVRALGDSDFLVVVVTNQSSIGRGITTAEEVNQINQEVERLARANGGRIDAWYVCPHAPRDNCLCRKPRPGLLQQAASDMSIDLSASYLVGDAMTDVQAAEAAGVQPILVLTGRGADEAARAGPVSLSGCLVRTDLAGAASCVLSQGDRLP